MKKQFSHLFYCILALFFLVGGVYLLSDNFFVNNSNLIVDEQKIELDDGVEATENIINFQITQKWSNDGNATSCSSTGNYKNGDYDLDSLGTVSAKITSVKDNKGNASKSDYTKGVKSVYKLSDTMELAAYGWCWWLNTIELVVSIELKVDNIEGFYSAIYCTDKIQTESFTGYYNDLSKSFTSTLTAGNFDENVYNIYITIYYRPQIKNVTFKSNGSNYTTISNTNTYKWVLPEEPTREGYTFDGWYTAEKGGDKIEAGSNFFSSSDLTVYAHWTPHDYTIRYNKNDGSSKDASQNYYYDEEKQLRSISDLGFDRDGYTFLGWADSQNGSVLYSDAHKILNLTSKNKAVIDLYAIWEANKYTLIFNKNKGSGSTEPTLNTTRLLVTYDSQYGALASISRVGYTFDGWYTAEQGGDKITSESIVKITQDTNLYAHWTANTYSIVFNACGGRGIMNKMTMSYDQGQYLSFNTFTRSGYIFVGWATTAEATKASYRDNQRVTNLTSVNRDTINLYAIWVETWANKVTKAAEGSGTKASPLIINTASDLAYLAYYVNYTENSSEIYIEQKSTIIMTGVTWCPIGTFEKPFKGSYNGNGFAIVGLTTPKYNDEYLGMNVGLFGYVSNAKLTSISILGGDITGDSNVGAIAGYSLGDTVIENCYVEADVKGNSNVGGIVGLTYGNTEIISCGFNKGIVEGKVNVSLIIGRDSKEQAKIKDCIVISSTNKQLSSSLATIIDCISISGDIKKYYGDGNFENWIITVDEIPVPAGLSWMATAGDKITSVNQLIELGYTKAN